MAVFQKTETHADDRPKRVLTKDDASFLAELQKELNTQDTMGQADPRYWVIRQSMPVPCGPDEAETVLLRDGDDWVRAPAGGSVPEPFLDRLAEQGRLTDAAASAMDLDELIEALDEAAPGRFSLAYEKETQAIVPGPLFLTHASCEDHLRRYGYDYSGDAHAYALTAFRSPEFERLLDLVRSVRWDEISIEEA